VASPGEACYACLSMMRWSVLLCLMAAIACRESSPSIGPEHAPPFDKRAAKRALNEATEHAASCGQSAGPRGEGRVECVYAPSGKVRAVHFLSGTFERTEVGDCVRSWFLKATVPAYSGPSPVFVSKTFAVH